MRLLLQGGSRDTILIPRYSRTPLPHHYRNGIQTYAVDYYQLKAAQLPILRDVQLSLHCSQPFT